MKCCLSLQPVQRKNGDPVAQLVEQYTFNVWVLGSSPNGITRKASQHVGLFYCYRLIAPHPN